LLLPPRIPTKLVQRPKGEVAGRERWMPKQYPYVWSARSGGMEVNEAQQAKQLLGVRTHDFHPEGLARARRDLDPRTHPK